METTIIKEGEEAPAPIEGKTFDMAVEFGQLRQAYQQNQAAIQSMLESLNRQSAEFNELRRQIEEQRRQTDSIGMSQESLALSQAALASEVTESSEENEPILVTPEVEEVVEVEAAPIPQRTLIQRLIYGNR